MKKLDILIFAAHPDDAELSCSGTIAKHISLKKKVGIIDLTKGELGSRGNAKTRMIESEKSSKILNLTIRENLGLEDGFFDENNKENKIEIIKKIRAYKPDIILMNAIEDRHPDHGRAATLIKNSIFLSGLIKIETFYNNKKQNIWRPKVSYHYIQDYYFNPNIVVDISKEWKIKMNSILAFNSQFYNKNSNLPETPISSKAFLEHIKVRALQFGKLIGTTYGEGFISVRPLGTNDLTLLI